MPYVNERTAFGEPISHRQAVAFSVADIAIELEGLRLVTLRAAARAEQGKEYAREAALARKLATDKGMQIGNAACATAGRARVREGASGGALVPRPAGDRRDGRRRPPLILFLAPKGNS